MVENQGKPYLMMLEIGSGEGLRLNLARLTQELTQAKGLLRQDRANSALLKSHFLLSKYTKETRTGLNRNGRRTVARG